MSLTTIEVECQLLDWSETAKGGAKIVLQLPDAAALDAFRSMTLAKKGGTGQRLMAVFVEIGDDEQPVTADPRPKGAALARLCGQWCNDERFQGWLRDCWPDVWSEWATDDTGNARCIEAVTAEVVRAVCRVGSRAELDHNDAAKRRFDELIRLPYAAWIRERPFA